MSRNAAIVMWLDNGMDTDNMSKVILYGPNWSAYVRTVRLALIEKGVAYQSVDVDFSSGDMPSEHFQWHPFGKVPVLEHGDFSIYETVAICRYIDAAFEGPPLQPSTAIAIGRMTQIIAVLDAYLSSEIRMGYVNERLFKPMLNLPVDETAAVASQCAIGQGFRALAKIVTASPYMVDDQLTLADLHAIPLFDYLVRSPGGAGLIGDEPVLDKWWRKVKSHPSVLQTQPDLSIFNFI